MVRFNPRARINRGRVRDTGGGGGFGGLGGGGLGSGSGMRLPIPTGRGGCGGLVLTVLVVVVLPLVLQQCAGMNVPVYPGGGDDGGGDTDRYEQCETGADANQDQDCARVLIENSITDYWESELGGKFRPIERLNTFSGQVSTGCGAADSSVGPFYCPADEQIYYDTTFYDQVLEQQLGGPDGGFVEFYVLAHEYGHHISNVLGYMSQVRSQQTGPTSPGVRLELQADCYAGMWAHGAESTEDEAGNRIIEDLTEQDITLAIEAAEAVGDDRIQRKTQGQVTPETWTHGSAEQRRHWFMVGYEQGDLEACDTFAASEDEVLGR